MMYSCSWDIEAPFCLVVGTCGPVQVVGGIKAGLSLQQQVDSFLDAAAACRQGGVNGRLRKVLKDTLHKWVAAHTAPWHVGSCGMLGAHMWFLCLRMLHPS